MTSKESAEISLLLELGSLYFTESFEIHVDHLEDFGGWRMKGNVNRIFDTFLSLKLYIYLSPHSGVSSWSSEEVLPSEGRVNPRLNAGSTLFTV